MVVERQESEIHSENNWAKPNFGAILGFIHEEAPNERAMVRLDVQSEHCNLRGMVHGGVLMSLMDATGLWAGVPKGEAVPSAATVSLNCSFLRGAKRGETTSLRAEALVTKRGRALHFASVSVYGMPQNTLLATGQGIYSWGATSNPSA
ncbi:PaaI family thioesterase [Pollutimonas nitritireducens]|nr:PaaI family thioesterase [Pollutimonas nitritireducens]